MDHDDTQDDTTDPLHERKMARLRRMAPPEMGPGVLIGEALARARPVGFAARVAWLWPGVKKRDLEALSSFYEDEVHRSLMELLDALFPLLDDPTPEAVSRVADAVEAIRCDTALSAELMAAVLHVFGRGREPDRALLAAETWFERGPVDAIARLADEAARDDAAGPCGSCFVVDEQMTGAVADTLNFLVAEGLAPSWRTLHHAGVQREELLELVPEIVPSARAPRARAL